MARLLPAALDAYLASLRATRSPDPTCSAKRCATFGSTGSFAIVRIPIVERAGAREPALLQVLVARTCGIMPSVRTPNDRRGAAPLARHAGCGRPGLVASHLPRTRATTKPTYRYREEATCVELGP
jgi:hypothetical protein